METAEAETVNYDNMAYIPHKSRTTYLVPGLSLLITLSLQAAWGCLDCLVIKKPPAVIHGLTPVMKNNR